MSCYQLLKSQPIVAPLTCNATCQISSFHLCVYYWFILSLHFAALAVCFCGNWNYTEMETPSGCRAHLHWAKWLISNTTMQLFLEKITNYYTDLRVHWEIDIISKSKGVARKNYVWQWSWSTGSSYSFSVSSLVFLHTH